MRRMVGGVPVTSQIPEKKKQLQKKNTLFEDVWGKSQACFGDEKLQQDSFLQIYPPENALHKNPEGATRNVRSLAGYAG